MSRALVELLQDHGLRAAMARRAYHYGRAMVWSQVARDYERLFTGLWTVPREVAVLDVSTGSVSVA
jgi:LDH2 family malate/lactate/ureidoglycolate dehydrogenase